MELLLAAGANWLVQDNTGRAIATAGELAGGDSSRRLDAIKLVEMWAAAHPDGPPQPPTRVNG